jgi:glucan phosphoethanolaminetransferase (alkaline phosphatase superfamily)
MKHIKILLSISTIIAVLPTMALFGAFFGLISDFSILNLFQDIKSNPDIFINQYSKVFALLCFFSPFSLLALLAIFILSKKLQRIESPNSDTAVAESE